VTVSAEQVIVNQRVSQVALRRANAIVRVLGRGLTGAQFRDGSISAVGLASRLRR
jgi:hypothetical protein